MNKLKYIFVSSTFSDFHSERDILNREILPKVNEKIRHLGYEVCFIDLRWGINDLSESENKKYLHIINECISEVRNSKPFFILFLGDNSGTRINKDIVRAIYRYNGIGDQYEEKSITQIEIDASPIFSNDNSRCLVFRRNLNNVSKDYKDIFVNKTNAAYEKKIKEALDPNNFVEYSGSVEDDGTVSFDTDLVANKIIDFIYNGFSKVENKISKQNIFEIEKDILDSRLEENACIFSGRQSYIERINKLLETKNIIKISGPSGIGKSSLLLKLFDEIQSNEKCCFLIGNCYGKGDIFELIDYICYHLCGHTLEKKDGNYFSNSVEYLLEDFYTELAKLNKKKTYYIFVDAFEKLETYGLINKDLIFNVSKLPQNVKLIYTGIGLKNPDVIVDEFEVVEIRDVIVKKVKYHRKELPNKFYDSVNFLPDIKRFKNPILLSLAIDDLIFIGREDYLRINCNNYNDSLNDLLLEKISNISKNANIEFARKLFLLEVSSKDALTYLKIISLHKKGCTLNQLKSIFELSGEKFSLLDFELAKSIFSSQIILDRDGNYHISHDLFKQAIKAKTSDEEVERLRKNSLNYLLVNDPYNFIETLELVKDINDPNLLRSVIQYIAPVRNSFFYLHSILNQCLCREDAKSTSLYASLVGLAKIDKVAFAFVITLLSKDFEQYYAYPLLDQVYVYVAPYLALVNIGALLQLGRTYMRSQMLHGHFKEAIKTGDVLIDAARNNPKADDANIFALIDEILEIIAFTKDVADFQNTACGLLNLIINHTYSDGKRYFDYAEEDINVAINISYIVQTIYMYTTTLEGDMTRPLSMLLSICDPLLEILETFSYEDSTAVAEFSITLAVRALAELRLGQFINEHISYADFYLKENKNYLKFIEHQLVSIKFLLLFNSHISAYERNLKRNILVECAQLIEAAVNQNLFVSELTYLMFAIFYDLRELMFIEDGSINFINALYSIDKKFDYFNLNELVILESKLRIKTALLYLAYFNDDEALMKKYKKDFEGTIIQISNKYSKDDLVRAFKCVEMFLKTPSPDKNTGNNIRAYAKFKAFLSINIDKYLNN